MTNLIAYAKTELEKIGIENKNITNIDDLWDSSIHKDVMELIAIFSSQGHSGTSSHQVISLFSKLANYTPLLPLTGEESEWVQVGEDLYQNKRASHVFKNNKNEAWDIQGKIFTDQEGNSYTNEFSGVRIQFPYSPKTEYIKTP